MTDTSLYVVTTEGAIKALRGMADALESGRVELVGGILDMEGNHKPLSTDAEYKTTWSTLFNAQLEIKVPKTQTQ